MKRDTSWDFVKKFSPFTNSPARVSGQTWCPQTPALQGGQQAAPVPWPYRSFNEFMRIMHANQAPEATSMLEERQAGVREGAWVLETSRPETRASILFLSISMTLVSFLFVCLCWPCRAARGILFATRLAGSLFPNQGLNPCPPQWERGVLTPGPPGNSP